jgi:putative transposase
MKTFYRQRLPHIQPKGAAFFVTFRLFGSIPYARLKVLKDDYHSKVNEAKSIKDLKHKNSVLFHLRKKYLIQADLLLHSILGGPTYLSEDEILVKTKEILHRFDGEFYDLICYCIMSNHVHILIDTSIQINEDQYLDTLTDNFTSLDKIMKRIKAPISRCANTYFNKSGQFWERESFDIYIRNEKMLNNVITYILENPVKAKMVDKWDDYAGNYLKIES